MTTTKRAIRGIALGGLTPGAIATAAPECRWVDPATLLVDDAYQRGLSEKSMRLIRAMVAGWDWRKFKPPVVSQTGEGLEVIDGQHTAIGAASHPNIERIPVMVVDTVDQADRARAFVGQNRDRVAITPMQMHHSAVAAGDEDALTLAQVCERAGARILRSAPAGGEYQPGDTVSIKAIANLISRRGAMGARVILEILVKAELAPVGQSFIRATEAVMHDEEYGATADQVTDLLTRYAPDALEREAAMLAFSHKQPTWKALAAVMFKNLKRGRRSGGGGYEGGER